jgi:hypothetical protein
MDLEKLKATLEEALSMAERMRKATADATPGAICYTLRAGLAALAPPPVDLYVLRSEITGAPLCPRLEYKDVWKTLQDRAKDFIDHASAGTVIKVDLWSNGGAFHLDGQPEKGFRCRIEKVQAPVLRLTFLDDLSVIDIKCVPKKNGWLQGSTVHPGLEPMPTVEQCEIITRGIAQPHNDNGAAFAMECCTQARYEGEEREGRCKPEPDPECPPIFRSFRFQWLNEPSEAELNLMLGL